ncbi:MAG: hypothetical protein LBQ84_07905 [Flavobacteriaceae bacterium]|jgi:hypothetical protein|nr:hypothetical protein [Flavobacteriaceae bacterium]
MKKNILAFAILSFTFFSCDNASGGNKNIIPADESQAEVSPHDAHAHAHAAPADSVNTEPTTHNHTAEKPADSIETDKAQ